MQKQSSKKSSLNTVEAVDVIVHSPASHQLVPITDERFVIDFAIDIFCSQSDIKATSMRVYKSDLKLFFDWVNKRGRDIKELTIADVKDWKNDLLDKGKSSLTIAGYLTALRKFYMWIENNNLGDNITRGIKTPRRVQQFQKQHLSKEKAAALIKHYNPSNKGEQQGEACKASLRNFAIVNLMLRTGLRTIEVIRADVGDVTFKDGKRVLWVHGKGHDTKDRYVMLTEKTYKPIQQYLSKERGGALLNEPLFTSESHRNGGQRLTTRTISWICKEGLKSDDVGLDGREYTAHSLRHTTAVMIIVNGGRLEDCQEVLRHANPATTQIYLNSIRDERRMKRFAESRIDKAF